MILGPQTPAVISGGASGLGAAAARALAALGVPVGILDRDSDKAAALAAEIGGTFAACDVADPQSVADGLQRIRAVQGQERLALACADIAPGARTLGRAGPHDPALFARTIAINLTGTFHLASLSAAGMALSAPIGPDGERGLIVATASIAAYEGQSGQIAYAASKAGVAGMILPMARDLATLGIRVMAIAPGIFDTPMVAGFSDELRQSLAQLSEFPRRLGQAADFALCVRQIAENPFLNGSIIRLDAATRLPAR